MRLYKTDENADFPEKVSRPYGNDYLNLRSSIRVDVRPGETLLIPTGFRISISKGQEVFAVDIYGSNRVSLESGKSANITITNHTDRNYLISVGQSIGRLEVYK